MEITKKKVITSTPFDTVDLLDIYEYGEATFGQKLADSFIDEIYRLLDNLETQYLLHPECRHLETKTKMYRNIILGSYLIIYRIRANKIEVLRAFHGSRSPKIIKQVRKIKP
jgi:plasmid stabilization system protein ParE